MSTWDEDWEEQEYESDEDGLEEDFENVCDCGRSGVSHCDCCGAPLCVMCSECQANFCGGCLNDPDFDKKMTRRYAELMEEVSEEAQVCPICQHLPCVCCGTCGEYPCICEYLEEQEQEKEEQLGCIEEIPF